MSSLEITSTFEFEQNRDGLFSIKHLPDNSAICVGYGDGSIDVVSMHNKEVLKNLAPNLRSSLAIMSLRFCSKLRDTIYAASSEGKIVIFNYKTGESDVVVHEKGNEITCLDFCADGTTFSTSGKDVVIRTYDSHTYQLVREYTQPKELIVDSARAGHWNKVFALKYHPDQVNVFCTGGWDKRIKIWDTRTKAGIISTITGPHVCGDGIDIRGRNLLTASWTVKEALQLWDFSEGCLIKNIEFSQKNERKPSEFLYCAQFIDGKRVIAGGSGSNSARLIKIDNNAMCGEVKLVHPVQSIDVWNNGTMAAIGGGGTLLYFAEIDKLD